MKNLGTCLGDVEINDYLSGSLSEEKKAEMERHLKDCGGCLEKLAFAYKTVEEFSGKKHKGEKSMKSMWKKNLWLFGAILTFTLSFLAPRYFIQLLVATILMGTKWIFDSVNARILIMIYDAWKKGGEKEASNIFRNLDDRFSR
ncbi:MAG: zf-HC2 domain-containing protein [Candidatus Omnitrophica bacterium]|nr:zf-HC2 domain-containing protein [Candidatus Omnitrophota bacterium]